MPHSYNFSGQMYLFPTTAVARLDTNSSEMMAFIVSGGVTEIPVLARPVGLRETRAMPSPSPDLTTSRTPMSHHHVPLGASPCVARQARRRAHARAVASGALPAQANAPKASVLRPAACGTA